MSPEHDSGEARLAILAEHCLTQELIKARGADADPDKQAALINRMVADEDLPIGWKELTCHGANCVVACFVKLEAGRLVLIDSDGRCEYDRQRFR